jgi:hypothetical protein
LGQWTVNGDRISSQCHADAEFGQKVWGKLKINTMPKNYIIHNLICLCRSPMFPCTFVAGWRILWPFTNKSPYPHSPFMPSFFKSSNRGRTWTPMQFYSSQCEKIYRRPKDAKIGKENEQANTQTGGTKNTLIVN